MPHSCSTISHTSSGTLIINQSSVLRPVVHLFGGAKFHGDCHCCYLPCFCYRSPVGSQHLSHADKKANKHTMEGTSEKRCRPRLGQGAACTRRPCLLPRRCSEKPWRYHPSSVQAPQVNRTSTWSSSTQARFQTLPSALRYAIFPISALPPHHPTHKTFTTSYTSTPTSSFRRVTS